MTTIPPGYVPQAPDTSAEIDVLMFEGWRRMTPEERLRRAAALGRLANRVALAGLRVRHPSDDDRTLRLRLLARDVGSDAVRLAYGVDLGE